MPHYTNNEINVVGTWHQNVHRKPWLIEKIIPEKNVTLRREPDNQHDRNAVAVDLDGQQLGYIPRKQAVTLAPILDRGSSYECAVKQKRRNRGRVEILLTLTTYPIKRTYPSARRSNNKACTQQDTTNTPTGKPFRKIQNIDRWFSKYNDVPGIYVIWNRKNKPYVGQSLAIGQRWRGHLNNLRARRHKNKWLQHDWTRMGADNFRFDLLEEIENPADLDEAEKRWIKEQDSFRNGYNVTPDGQGIDPTQKASLETQSALINNEPLIEPTNTIAPPSTATSSSTPYEKGVSAENISGDTPNPGPESIAPVFSVPQSDKKQNHTIATWIYTAIAASLLFCLYLLIGGQGDKAGNVGKSLQTQAVNTTAASPSNNMQSFHSSKSHAESHKNQQNQSIRLKEKPMPLDEERTAVTDLQPAIIRTKTVKDNLGTINILEPVKAETEYTGHKVAIGFHNIDIRTAMDMFSQISGREINVADEIDGIVTVNVGTPEPWDKIFSELLERNRLEAVFSGNTIRVIPKSIDEQQY